MKEDLSSLQEIRLSIDKIDQEIIQLLSKRSTYVKQAAKYKKNPSQIEAPDRVEEVIRKIRITAQNYSLEPDFAEKIYRIIIKAFIEQETENFKNN